MIISMQQWIIVTLLLGTMLLDASQPQITLKGRNSEATISHEVSMFVPYLQERINSNSLFINCPHLENDHLIFIKEYATRRYQIYKKECGILGFHDLDPNEELLKVVSKLQAHQLAILTHWACLFFPTETIPLNLLEPWTRQIKENNLGINDVQNILGEKANAIFEAYVNQNPPIPEKPIAPDISGPEKLSTDDNTVKKSYFPEWHAIKTYIKQQWQQITIDQISFTTMLSCYIILGYIAWKHPYSNLFLS